MATGQVKGEWQNSTPRRSETPEPIDTKFETGDYVRETTPVQNFVQIRPLGASWQMGEI